jgi:hypothetical protein
MYIFVILHNVPTIGGSSSVGRASASQAEGRAFEPRFPLLKIKGLQQRNCKPFLFVAGFAQISSLNKKSTLHF